jgi:hypothetical protein
MIESLRMGNRRIVSLSFFSNKELNILKIIIFGSLASSSEIIPKQLSIYKKQKQVAYSKIGSSMNPSRNLPIFLCNFLADILNNIPPLKILVCF